MKSSAKKRYIAITAILLLIVAIAQAKPKKFEQVLKVSLQKRIPSDQDEGAA